MSTGGELSGRSMEIGTAAEHIACADLILAGHRAFLSAAGLPYDLILDVRGRLVRVAVKGCGRPRRRPARENSRLCYQFGATRPKHSTKDGHTARPYTIAETDMMAFVALDLRIVAYAALVDRFVTIWHIDPPGTPPASLDSLGRRAGQQRKRFEDFTIERALRAMGIGS